MLQPGNRHVAQKTAAATSNFDKIQYSSTTLLAHGFFRVLNCAQGFNC
jgi:hypothetical protein